LKVTRVRNNGKSKQKEFNMLGVDALADSLVRDKINFTAKFKKIPELPSSAVSKSLVIPKLDKCN
jgi:hypothetical protein